MAKLQGVVDACNPKVVLLSADVNRLRRASKLNFLSSVRRLWPDLPYETLGSSAVSNNVGGGVGGGAGGGQSSAWFGYRGGAAGAGVQCFDEDSLQEDDVAFLQFTSGSTSEPKGVMVTFANLMHNALYISRKAERVSGPSRLDSVEGREFGALCTRSEIPSTVCRSSRGFDLMCFFVEARM